MIVVSWGGVTARNGSRGGVPVSPDTPIDRTAVCSVQPAHQRGCAALPDSGVVELVCIGHTVSGACTQRQIVSSPFSAEAGAA